jgi:Epoxide hydrolase N terminus
MTWTGVFGTHNLCANLDGQVVHLLHLPGRGPDPMPLLLTHGWPGSFCEYLDLLPLLTDPEVTPATRSPSSCHHCPGSASPPRRRPGGSPTARSPRCGTG